MIAKTPEIILTTKDETLDWLMSHDETFDWCRQPVKSIWLCEELNRFEADGYVYNRPAQERIARENGLSVEETERRVPGVRTRTEGGLLGALVYLAQKYRDEMNLERSGFVRATQEALAPFEGKLIEAHNNGSLTGNVTVKVKRIGDRLRLCPPKSRTKAYVEYQDWWVRKAA